MIKEIELNELQLMNLVLENYPTCFKIKKDFIAISTNKYIDEIVVKQKLEPPELFYTNIYWQFIADRILNEVEYYNLVSMVSTKTFYEVFPEDIKLFIKEYYNILENIIIVNNYLNGSIKNSFKFIDRFNEYMVNNHNEDCKLPDFIKNI